MLVQRHVQGLNAGEWEVLDIKVELPDALRETFFARSGPTHLCPEDNRGYHRYFMRAQAVLLRGEMKLGIYTKDVSRQGMGLLSPVQLFPLDLVRLKLPNGSELSLEIARCRRLDRACFDCGARFALRDRRGISLTFEE